MNKPKRRRSSDKTHKPIIETLINTTALSLTATAVVMLNSRDPWGLLLIAIGMGLEFAKYWGRDRLW